MTWLVALTIMISAFYFFRKRQIAAKYKLPWVKLCTIPSAYALEDLQNALTFAKIPYRTEIAKKHARKSTTVTPASVLHIQPGSDPVDVFVLERDLTRAQEILTGLQNSAAYKA